MFIGNLVKLKSDVQRRNDEYLSAFVKSAIEQDWIWLIAGMDDENLDYIINPLYIEEESNLIQMGMYLMVTEDELEIVDINRKDLFTKLNRLRNLETED
jgi:hypothetical protein